MGLTDEALALAFRTGMPYVGLRDHAHDPELDHLIPPDAARTARVIPLAADDDRIRLAVADPAPDLSPLDPYLSGRQVHLALAPREELDAILGPPPVRVAEAAPATVAEPAAADGDAEPPAPDAAPIGDEEEPGAEAEGDGDAEEPTLASAVDASPTEGAAEAEEQALAAARDVEADASPAAEGAAVADAPLAAAPPADDHPELAGEVPSWLEPRRRRWRVVLALIVLFLVLIAAAAVLYAYVVT